MGSTHDGTEVPLSKTIVVESSDGKSSVIGTIDQVGSMSSEDVDKVAEIVRTAHSEVSGSFDINSQQPEAIIVRAIRLLRAIDRVNGLCEGGEQYPNAACVWESVKDLEKLLLELTKRAVESAPIPEILCHTHGGPKDSEKQNECTKCELQVLMDDSDLSVGLYTITDNKGELKEDVSRLDRAIESAEEYSKSDHEALAVYQLKHIVIPKCEIKSISV